jgi:hypothetical protein
MWPDGNASKRCPPTGRCFFIILLSEWVMIKLVPLDKANCLVPSQSPFMIVVIPAEMGSANCKTSPVSSKINSYFS